MAAKSLPDARDIFLQALDRSSEQWSSFLDTACGFDSELRAAVERLLDAHSNLGSFMAQPVAPPATADKASSQSPARTIGRYKVLEKLGEGGMGVVFIAEQTEPVRRRVALKLIKPGMDSRQIVGRFAAERQALALMEHPNIARVLDGGSTEQGHPYFVMELVQGAPINKYCDAQQLTIRHRLELFVDVCRAIQHAHTKGIIHRDLKPSNVMVAIQDDAPVPKVIDFGVAKAIGQPLTDQTVFTEAAQMLGTPMYMSPEQAICGQADVDTRSDVYSLGVLLYELLTGTTPFDRESSRRDGYVELRRLIREQEPPLPSRRLSTLAAGVDETAAQCRGLDSRKLCRLLRGELDWIVMKALEKDRARRYQSAAALTQDIQRYLRGEPVEAGPPSATYRLRKLARKHRTGLGVAGGIAVLLAILAGGLGWNLREHAMREAATERAVDTILREADVLQAARDVPRALDKVKQAEAILAGRASNSADVLRVRSRGADLKLVRDLEDVWTQPSTGFILTGLRSFDESERTVRTLFRRHGIDVDRLPPEEAGRLIRGNSVAVELAAALDEWALAVRRARTEDEARWRRVIQIARIADPDPLRNTLREAMVDNQLEVLVELATSVSIRELPPGTAVMLGNALSSPGQREAAIVLLHDAQRQYPADFWINIALARRLADDTRPSHYTFGEATAGAKPASLKSNEAVRYYSVAVALRPDCIFARNELGIALLHCGRHAEAVAEFRRVLQFVPLDADQGHFHLGNALAAKGENETAIAEFRRAIELRPDHWQARANLGGVFLNLGRLAEAEAELRQAVLINPEDTLTHFNLGLIAYKRGELKEAIAAMRHATRLDPGLADAHLNLASYLFESGETDEALTAIRRAILLSPDDAMAHYNLGVALSHQGQKDAAAAAYRQAIACDPMFAGAWFNLGNTSEDLGRLDDAIAAWREAIRLDPSHVGAHRNLGLVLIKQEQWAEAIALRERVVTLEPEDPLNHCGLAWALIHAADAQDRDLARALEAAEASVKLAPRSSDCWRVLGMTYYRNGTWQKSIDALVRSRDRGADTSFFLAMAHGKLGDRAEAKARFEAGNEWMQNNQSRVNDPLLRCQAEAAELLGIEVPGLEVDGGRPADEKLPNPQSPDDTSECQRPSTEVSDACA